MFFVYINFYTLRRGDHFIKSSPIGATIKRKLIKINYHYINILETFKTTEGVPTMCKLDYYCQESAIMMIVKYCVIQGV